MNNILLFHTWYYGILWPNLFKNINLIAIEKISDETNLRVYKRFKKKKYDSVQFKFTQNIFKQYSHSLDNQNSFNFFEISGLHSLTQAFWKF